MSNAARSFGVLITNLNTLHNYFSTVKLFSAEFLNIFATKLFFPSILG